MSDRGDEGAVVPLRESPPETPVLPPVTPPGRLHSLAIGGLVISSIAGIGSMLAFVTVGWPGKTGRVWVTILIFSVVVFVASAAIAVFAAARDTYPRRGNP